MSVNEIVELVPSPRGFFLHINGFTYYKHSGAESRRYWNCRRQPECNARAITGAHLTVIKGPNESSHNHAPNLEEVEALKIQGRIKRKAIEDPGAPAARIMRTELRDVPSAILAELPDRVNLRKKLSRRRLQHMPSNPLHLSDLEDLPQKYHVTLGGDKFLYYDSLDDEDEDESDLGRILIFTTAENLKILFRSKVWFVDGTFKTAPTIFFQLFSILAAVSQVGINKKRPQTVGIPLVHALLENKQQSSYDKVFHVTLNTARRLGLTQLPTTIMSDFEVAIINAAQEHFGEDSIKLCFFHLCQSVYRHIVSEGLQTEYRDNIEIKASKRAGRLRNHATATTTWSKN